MSPDPLVYLTRAAVVNKDRTARLHWPGPNPFPQRMSRYSACGAHVLATDTGRDPAAVPDDRRCHSAGCARRWRDIAGHPTLTTAEESP